MAFQTLSIGGPTSDLRPTTPRGQAGGRRAAALLAALALPLVGGCNIRQVLDWDMYNQPKVSKPYRPSDFFADKTSARPLVAGTVPRKEVFVDRSSVGVDYVAAQYAGDGYPDGTLGEGDAVDPAKLKAALERGQTVYNVYCAVCHGRTGKGDGMIVQRGFSKPPSFVVPPDAAEKEAMQKGDPYRWQRTEILQTVPPRHVYNAISQGFGAMYSYGERVKPVDRWKVAAYVKALQANPAEAPPPARPHSDLGPAAPHNQGPGEPPTHSGTGTPAAK
jgi:mono/diheme cytochrome c family protein